MQLAQDVADVGLFAVFLQGLVDDVERVTRVAVGVDAFDVDAGDKFIEDFAAHHFKSFACFIVFVCGFFGFTDSGIAGKSRHCDDVVEGGATLCQEFFSEVYGFGKGL